MCSQDAGNAILETQVLKNFSPQPIPPPSTRVSGKLVPLSLCIKSAHSQFFENTVKIENPS